jgi:GNAT superfamily N-acetyltransferase
MTRAADSAAGGDREWLSRVEEAGLNASAPVEQRWIDGWLVRLAPGKARRARCVQPVAPGRLGVDEKLARCLPLYAAAGLQFFVRITPFAQPAGLDAQLAERGMEAIDETVVLTLRSLDHLDSERPDTSAAVRFQPVDAATFVDWVAAARGSSAHDREGHRRRLVNAPIPHHAFLLRESSGEPLAGGQVVIEDAIAGLYDIFTLPSARGRGHAERLCRHLLSYARGLGATAGYLQVEATNATAVRVYRRIGFQDGYRYHYRTPAQSTAA